MASHTLHSFISVESHPGVNDRTSTEHAAPAAPQKALARTYHSVPQAPEEYQLQSLQQGMEGGSAREATSPTASGTQSPRSSGDLEISRPASPVQEVEALQSFTRPYMNRFRMSAVCSQNFVGGLNDSAPGALIPYMETHYKIGYTVVSLIFVSNAVGFISAAFIVDALRARVGRAKTLMISNIIMACAYIIIVCTPPFPAVIVAYFLVGLGYALNLSLGNVFAANLQQGTTMLGAMHGSYGIGGTIAPLVATSMVTSGGLIWSRYFILPLSVVVFNFAFAGWSFWNYEKESTLSGLTNTASTTAHSQVTSAPENAVSARGTGQISKLLKPLTNKIVVLGALFIFAYQGAEVSISGWVISFLINTRKGNPNTVGYVTSGFWGGITLGRFFLSAPAHKIGEKLFVYMVVVGAAGFQLLVWFVPNVIGDAVAVSIVGLLLGPVYPCAAAVFARLINRKDQVRSMSFISALGSSGGAVAPFTTGALAQAVGTFVLSPVAIVLFGVMLVCWFLLPAIHKRRE